MFRTTILAASLLLATGTVQAVEAPPGMRSFVETEVMSWAQSQQVITAILAQNTQTGSATQAQIDAWDLAWRGEVGQAEQPLIQQVMTTPLSAFLHQQVLESGGRITEVFVMDARGLNVAASGITSDYWQGDEDKYSKSFGAGAGAIFVDEVEFDESSQSYQGQVSIALTDPATGEVVGAMTVGLNAEAFF